MVSGSVTSVRYPMNELRQYRPPIPILDRSQLLITMGSADCLGIQAELIM